MERYLLDEMILIMQKHVLIKIKINCNFTKFYNIIYLNYDFEKEDVHDCCTVKKIKPKFYTY